MHIADVDGTQNVPVPIVAIGAAHNPVNLFGVSALSGVELLRDLIETCESEGKKIEPQIKRRRRKKEKRRKRNEKTKKEKKTSTCSVHRGHFWLV